MSETTRHGERAHSTPAAVPRVSVIIPVRNDAHRLGLCLEALAAQTDPCPTFEVLVVDNGSDVSPRDTVTPFAWTRCIVEERPGSYAARNRGLQEATGDVVAFTDADCIPDPAWLSNAITMLDAVPGWAALAGRIELSCRDPVRPTAAELYELATAFQQRSCVEQHHFGATANLFVRRGVFETIGVFDPQMFSGGDVELCRRLVARGFDLRYADDVVVWHPARSSIGALVRKKRRIVAGAHQFEEQPPQRRPLGRLGQMIRLAVVDVSEGWVRSRHPRVRGLGQRCKVVLVHALLHYVRIAEKVRLRLGGVPLR